MYKIDLKKAVECLMDMNLGIRGNAIVDVMPALRAALGG